MGLKRDRMLTKIGAKELIQTPGYYGIRLEGGYHDCVSPQRNGFWDRTLPPKREVFFMRSIPTFQNIVGILI
jgi:hypothetical protein